MQVNVHTIWTELCLYSTLNIWLIACLYWSTYSIIIPIHSSVCPSRLVMQLKIDLRSETQYKYKEPEVSSKTDRILLKSFQMIYIRGAVLFTLSASVAVVICTSLSVVLYCMLVVLGLKYSPVISICFTSIHLSLFSTVKIVSVFHFSPDFTCYPVFSPTI
jgi:hypothetical protein